MTVPEIETRRLLLRWFTAADLAAMSRIFCDPAVTKFIAEGRPALPSEVPLHLNSLINNYWGEYGFGRWALVDKASGEVIGYCGFRINEGRTELHYLLARAYWCAGLATEAARAALRYAFEELRLTEIIALVRPENTASARVLKKIGMRHTGRQERFFGHNFDRYLITMSDYQADNAPYSFRLTSVA